MDVLLHCHVDDKCISHFSQDEGDNVLWLDGVQAEECIWNQNN